jgi:hypothetical protein
MHALNLILNAANETLEVTNLQANTNPATGSEGRIAAIQTIPLGTPSDSATGPLAVKVVLVGGSLTPTNPLNPGMPGAANYVAYTYTAGGTTNNIATATYKTGGAGGTTIAVYTYTYVSGGVADNDRVATLTIS